MDVRVLVHPGEGLLHDLPHRLLVDVAHVVALHPDLMEQFLFPLVHRAQSDLADLVVPHRGRRPGHRSQPVRAVPEQAGHRHPVQVAARRDRGGVEVGMGIEPEDEDLLPGGTAVAHDRRDRPDGQTVVTAERDRQTIPSNSANTAS